MVSVVSSALQHFFSHVISKRHGFRKKNYLTSNACFDFILIFLKAFFVLSIRLDQVKVGLINLCKGLFSLNARIYYKLKSGT
jgi:hypothetical protein